MNADKRRYRCNTSAFAIIAVLATAAALTSSGAAADKTVCNADDVKRLSRIPAVSDEYKRIRDMQYWRNPYLFALRTGVELRLGGNGKGTQLSISELPHALADLPESAWPYGRIIGVQNQALGSGDDFKYVHANRNRVVVLLKCLRVEPHLVPTA